MKALVLAAALTAPLPAGQHSHLRATFAEDFSHFAASPTGILQGRAVWQTSFNGGLRTLQNNHEAEWYGDNGPEGPFSLQHGALTITARPAPGLPHGLAYVSGLITTQQTFTQTYGYFEIRAQLPRGTGFWPAFWLLPADGSWPPEIDVMEMLGGEPRDYYASVHAQGGPAHVDQVTKITAPDLTAGFHVFGMSWRPDDIRFYLDGALVNDIRTPPDMHKPMYLLANLAVGGPDSWPGVTAGETGAYRIDWIRAWQFDDIPPAPPP